MALIKIITLSETLANYVNVPVLRITYLLLQN